MKFLRSHFSKKKISKIIKHRTRKLKHVDSLEVISSEHEPKYKPGWTIDSLLGTESADDLQGSETSESGYWQ